jgi:hypothetical protein
MQTEHGHEHYETLVADTEWTRLHFFRGHGLSADVACPLPVCRHGLDKDADTIAERKENHTLTVRETARMFDSAGAARTERSIINWCQPNRQGITRADSDCR